MHFVIFEMRPVQRRWHARHFHLLKGEAGALVRGLCGKKTRTASSGEQGCQYMTWRCRDVSPAVTTGIELLICRRICEGTMSEVLNSSEVRFDLEVPVNKNGMQEELVSASRDRAGWKRTQMSGS